jgi:hypothetical protein
MLVDRMLVDMANSVEVDRPITREEIVETYRYRVVGLIVASSLDHHPDESEIKEIVRDLLCSIYRSITEPNYRPDKGYLEMYDKLGRLTEMFVKIDGQNYIPASECLDDVHVTTFKQLHAVLRAHPEIRREKPSPQRLMIHAADWAHHIRKLNRQAGQALDVADDFADEAKKRQERLKELKLADFMKKLPG